MILRLAWLEAKLLLREPITLVFVLGLPLVMQVVMGAVFGNDVEEGFYRGVGAMDYYMGAYVALVVAALGFINLPTHLAAYRERGVLRRFEASSIPRASLISAQMVVMVVLSAIGALLVSFAGWLEYHPVAPANLAQVVGAFLLAAVAFAAIGALIGLAVPTARAAQGIGIMLWFVAFMVAGGGPPPEVLPDGMNFVGSLTPLKHAIVLVQDGWLGFGWNWTEAGILAAFLVGSLALIAYVLRRRSAK
jgi:ABC-2 type transport system permease protein